jgi:hypothetical protein
MPQTYDSLRRKFMHDGSDGIGEAETILRDAGYMILNGVVTMPPKFDVSKHTVGEIDDAVTFLVEEWDYSNG